MTRRKKYSAKQTAENLMDVIFHPGSATDCTGVIPSAPKTDIEYQNYDDLYTFLPKPIAPKEKQNQKHPSANT